LIFIYVMIHLHAFQNILTDSTTRFSDTTPAPEATEARAGNCQRSGYAGGGCNSSLLRGFLSANKRRPAACNGSYRPPLGDSKASVCSFQKSHALSIAADRDIVICGTTYILVRIVLQAPNPGQSILSPQTGDRVNRAGNRPRSVRGDTQEGTGEGAA